MTDTRQNLQSLKLELARIRIKPRVTPSDVENLCYAVDILCDVISQLERRQ